MLVRVRALPVQSQGGVGVELADHAVAGSEDGGGQDDAQRDQLRRDALQLAQTLGDGVSYRFLRGTVSTVFCLEAPLLS